MGKLKMAWVSDTPEAVAIGNSRVCREMSKYFRRHYDLSYVSFAVNKDKINKVTEYEGCKLYNVTRDNKDMIIKSLVNIAPDIIVFSHDPFLFNYIEKIKAMPEFKNTLVAGLFTLDGEPVSPYWAQALDNCDVIFTPSHWAKKALMKFNPYYYVYVIAHGLNNETFVPNPTPKDKIKTDVTNATKNSDIKLDLEDKFICFFIGNNQDRKGLGVARDAWMDFAHGKEDKVRWILVTHNWDDKGSHFFPYYLFEHPTILNITCDVKEQDVVGFYHLSDFLLYPTMGDGFSLICMEALACGCTPIVTNWSSQTDFCNDTNSEMINDYTLLRGQFGCYRSVVIKEGLVKILEKAYDLWANDRKAYEEIYGEKRRNGIMLSRQYVWDNECAKMHQVLNSFYEIKHIRKQLAKRI